MHVAVGVCMTVQEGFQGRLTSMLQRRRAIAHPHIWGRFPFTHAIAGLRFLDLKMTRSGERIGNVRPLVCSRPQVSASHATGWIRYTASCIAPGYGARLLSVQYHQGCFQPAHWIGHSFSQECRDGLSFHRLFGEGMPRRSRCFAKRIRVFIAVLSSMRAEPQKSCTIMSDCFTRLSSLLARVTSRHCEPYSAYDHYALLALSADTLVSFGSSSWRNAAGHRPAEMSILGSLEVKR